ncbi:MAG: hypothetical protein JW893_06820 [Candidatus Omnitrophica bacterium]|nr:hypothetical protein [Candidatus Omnitrophota bacterium]
MAGYKKWIFVLIMIVFVVGGCTLHEELLPLHNEVLMYKLPYDLTYLRTFEALETFDDWEIEETEKGKGLIRVRNLAYGSFGDADKRIITFYIKRYNRDMTTVQLAPESQRVLGGGMLLERIGEFLTEALAKRA